MRSFPYVFVWPKADLWSEILAVLILSQKLETPGSKLGVGTGWSGPKTLFDHRYTAALEAFIRSQLARVNPEGWLPDWPLSGWGNVMHRGDVVAQHNHVTSHLGGRNTWSGVYFVTTPPGSGALVIEGRELIPAAGTLVIFPSETDHEVRPHESDLPRLSIAFNARSSAGVV